MKSKLFLVALLMLSSFLPLVLIETAQAPFEQTAETPLLNTSPSFISRAGVTKRLLERGPNFERWDEGNGTVSVTFWADDVYTGENETPGLDVTIQTTASDGYIYQENRTYQGARDAASGTRSYGSDLQLIVGQKIAPNNNYLVYKTFLYFDTSSLPDDATIASATLSLYLAYTLNTATWDIVVQNGQPTYPHDPLVLADFNQTYYNGDGGRIAALDIVAGYNDITLNENAQKNWIRKDNITKLALRSSKDIDNQPPSSGEREIRFHSYERSSGYPPTLTVLLTPPPPPSSGLPWIIVIALLVTAMVAAIALYLWRR